MRTLSIALAALLAAPAFSAAEECGTCKKETKDTIRIVQPSKMVYVMMNYSDSKIRINRDIRLNRPVSIETAFAYPSPVLGDPADLTIQDLESLKIQPINFPAPEIGSVANLDLPAIEALKEVRSIPFPGIELGNVADINLAEAEKLKLLSRVLTARK